VLREAQKITGEVLFPFLVMVCRPVVGVLIGMPKSAYQILFMQLFERGVLQYAPLKS
jgi:hypothetical protein